MLSVALKVLVSLALSSVLQALLRASTSIVLLAGIHLLMRACCNTPPAIALSRRFLSLL